MSGTDRDPLYYLRRAIAAAPGELTEEEEILRTAHNDIVELRADEKEGEVDPDA